MRKLNLQILMIILLSFLFSGCSQKIVFKDKLVCSNQKILSKIEIVDIAVHKDSIKMFKEKRDALYYHISFYENQVLDNNKICENIEKGNE